MLFPEKPLPEEVTELILLCLPFPVLRETVPFVCKSWAECVQVGDPTGLGLEKRLILLCTICISCSNHDDDQQSASFWRRYVRRQRSENKNGVSSATILSPQFSLASWRILADLFHSNPFDRNLGSSAAKFLA